MAARGTPDLTRYAWLSIGAALVTIALKAAAYLVTGSVGLLSDAAESVVNLVAAVIALIALKVAARPPDAGHQYGHGKAEYFSAGLEGLMIFVAAAVILASAVERFFHPVALERLGTGLAISTAATAVNGAVGLVLIRAGRAHRSATLTADGKHLMTDVWTSVGVLIGVLLVALTGWQRLDPVVAAIVGVNILVTGYRLVVGSAGALLDAALTPQEIATVTAVLDQFRSTEVEFHGLQTRQSGRHRFVAVHVLVPGAWTVFRGHHLLEDIESAIRAALPDTSVETHLEPREDPAPTPTTPTTANPHGTDLMVATRPHPDVEQDCASLPGMAGGPVGAPGSGRRPARAGPQPAGGATPGAARAGGDRCATA